MSRPMPHFPRGPRRAPSPRQAPVLLAIPRLAPDYELAAVRALIKPQTKGAVLHRSGQQSWPGDAPARIESARQIVRDRLGYEPQPHLPEAGDFFMVVTVPPEDRPAGLALALMLSRAFPQTWLIFDRLFVRDGAFYRRRRRFLLELTRANDVHLPRAVRAALRGAL